jgi:energy-coupling factor transporter transmembrane protein EcfT
MVHEKVSMGLDWYIKWFASIVLIIGAAVTALDMYPYNMYFQFVGITGWLIVGIMWKDWALIVVNTVGSLILFAGIIHYLTTQWYLTIYSNYIEVLL